MPIDRQNPWLTPDAYERVRNELVRLRDERSAPSMQDPDEEQRRERRIRKLSELLLAATVGHEPPDDGVAEPGMLVTVRYEADGLTDQFLMADHAESVDDDYWICSAESPLGAALYGARVGEHRQFRLPAGEWATVMLVDAVPYRAAGTSVG